MTYMLEPLSKAEIKATIQLCKTYSSSAQACVTYNRRSEGVNYTCTLGPLHQTGGKQQESLERARNIAGSPTLGYESRHVQQS